jgi:shikimate kinase
MGSGKSRMGKELAEKIGYLFIDIDDLFEEKYRITILDFFEKYGESHFRRIESDLLREAVNQDRVVISTGGGTPCFYDNMKVIKENGMSIYLKMSVDELVKRLQVLKKKRPLLKDKSHEDLEAFVNLQLKEREYFYNQADVILCTADHGVEKIVELIEGFQALGTRH